MMVKAIKVECDNYHPARDGRMLGAMWTECSACRVWIMAGDKQCRGCGGKVEWE